MKVSKYHSFTLLFLCIAHLVSAQDCSFFAKKYPFLHCEKNILQMRGHASDKFVQIFAKLEDLETNAVGKVNILHFGDSHIQADYIPNHMRQLLKTRFPIRDRGLIFPFTVAKSNNPHNYSVDYSGEWVGLRNALVMDPCDLGVTGMSITTQDPLACLQISQPESGYVTSPFTRIRVFHSIGENVPDILLMQQQNLLYKFTNETLGYTLFLLKKPMKALTLMFDFDEAGQEISLYGISLETGNVGFTYSSLGVNGSKVRSLLKSNLLEQQLFVLAPDLLIFSYGTNDVYRNYVKEEFEEEYSTLLKRIRSILPDISILLTTPGDALRDRKHPMPELQEVREVIFKVAQEYDCAVWDFYDIMGGKGSIEAWSKAGLTNQDKLHFIKKAYELQAELLYEAILKSYEDYQACYSVK